MRYTKSKIIWNCNKMYKNNINKNYYLPIKNRQILQNNKITNIQILYLFYKR